MTDDRAVRLALEVAHLTAERDALRATVERVEAWRIMAEARVRLGISCDCHADITTALGPAS